MEEDLLRIIDTLDHKNQITVSLQRDAIHMMEGKQSPGQFLERVKKERENHDDCLRCNGRPFCCFFLAFTYLRLGDIRQAKSQAREAVEEFSIRGINWNQAMSYWLLGVILLREGKRDLAEYPLQKALGILVKLLEDFKLEANYQRAQKCEGHILHIRKALQGASDHRETPPGGPASTSGDPDAHAGGLDGQNGVFLTIPWIPVYKRLAVEAGSNGPIWIEPDIKGKSELAEIYFEGARHTIHATRHSNQRLSLSEGKHYGWVKVHGQSMNNATPTPIHENDYVLFYESDWPDTNEIVIVSKVDPAFVEEGLSFMIKRYSKEERQLQSETSLMGVQYDSINITKDCCCLGTVVAVAKPIKA